MPVGTCVVVCSPTPPPHQQTSMTSPFPFGGGDEVETHPAAAAAAAGATMTRPPYDENVLAFWNNGGADFAHGGGYGGHGGHGSGGGGGGGGWMSGSDHQQQRQQQQWVGQPHHHATGGDNGGGGPSAWERGHQPPQEEEPQFPEADGGLFRTFNPPGAHWNLNEYAWDWRGNRTVSRDSFVAAAATAARAASAHHHQQQQQQQQPPAHHHTNSQFAKPYSGINATHVEPSSGAAAFSFGGAGGKGLMGTDHGALAPSGGGDTTPPLEVVLDGDHGGASSEGSDRGEEKLDDVNNKGGDKAQGGRGENKSAPGERKNVGVGEKKGRKQKSPTTPRGGVPRPRGLAAGGPVRGGWLPSTAMKIKAAAEGFPRRACARSKTAARTATPRARRGWSASCASITRSSRTSRWVGRCGASARCVTCCTR